MFAMGLVRFRLITPWFFQEGQKASFKGSPSILGVKFRKWNNGGPLHGGLLREPEINCDPSTAEFQRHFHRLLDAEREAFGRNQRTIRLAQHHIGCFEALNLSKPSIIHAAQPTPKKPLPEKGFRLIITLKSTRKYRTQAILHCANTTQSVKKI